MASIYGNLLDQNDKKIQKAVVTETELVFGFRTKNRISGFRLTSLVSIYA